MRKAALIMFMVIMFATPCLAQEIEPAGLFSMIGTLWEFTWDIDEMNQIGFHGDVVFQVNETRMSNACLKGHDSSYSDFILFGFFEYFNMYDDMRTVITTWDRGIVFPLLGVGFMKRVYTVNNEETTYQRILKKIADNWQPPPWCVVQ